jgi:phage I-like protein
MQRSHAFEVRTGQELPAGVGDALPTEFRIFSPGVIETSKGPDLFDEEAARSVMKYYVDEGVDVPVDLEHDSLNGQGLRADEKDARGWFKLELRADGSLWAVDVRWTPDGERRLREKTQRYISPAFVRDKETGRITRLLNVAIVSMPATYDAAPLVAASRVTPHAPRKSALFAVVASRALALCKKRARLAK